MRAAYYDRNGPAREVLEVGEVSTPSPGPGEVLVRVHASGVNPSDWKTRAGSRPMTASRVVPHSDGAGEIEATGEGVDRSRIGERVWLWNGQWKRAFGTAAQHIALPARQAVPLPDHVPFEAGACLGIPAMTAAHAVSLGARPDEVLLVSGGAGAVSHYAIQFAKARGTTVITTVSSPLKGEAARRAGADHVIDYRTEDVGKRVKSLTDGRGVDRVIELDIVANATLLPGVLAPGATVVVYGTGGPEATIPSGFCLVNSITLAFFLVYELRPAERSKAIELIQTMLAGDLLNHNVAAVMALDEIVEAHERLEAGAVTGNLVLRPS